MPNAYTKNLKEYASPNVEGVKELLLQRTNPLIASALLGHMDVETGGTYDYKQKQKGGEGYGLLQFSGKMKEAYFDYLKKNKTEDSAVNQVDFIGDVLGGDEHYDIGAGNRQKIQEAFKEGNLENITAVLQDRFIKAGKPHMQRRFSSANTWLNKLGGRK